MRKAIFLFMLSCCMQFAFAQESPSSDQIMYRGYLIKFSRLSSKGYGYDIFFQRQLVVHQFNNPFDFSPVGLPKEDALKVAQWQIQQLNQQQQPNKRHVQINQQVPKSVARQLKVSSN